MSAEKGGEKSIADIILDNPSFQDLKKEEIDQEIVSIPLICIIVIVERYFQIDSRWERHKGIQGFRSWIPSKI